MNYRFLFISLALLMLFNALIASPITWDENGVPIRQGVNIEWSRAAAELNNGTVVFVWSDTRYGGRDLWAQAVGKDGVVWEKSILIDGKTDRQEDPVIIGTSDGNAIIAWVDFHYDEFGGDIAAQKISPEGELLWETTRDLCLADGIQISLNIVPDNDGGAIVIWLDDRNGFTDIYGVHIDGDGNNYPGWPEDGLALAVGNYAQHSHTLWEDGENGAILAYVNASSSPSIEVIRILEEGEIAWSKELAIGAREYGSPRLSPIGEDAFGIAYIDAQNSYRNIYVSAFDKNGDDLWAEPKPVFESVKEQLNPRVATATDGGFIVVWEDTRNSSMSSQDLYVQKVDLDGNFLWEDGGIALFLDDFEQKNPRIESDKNGGAFITWEDARTGNYPIKEIYVQHFLSDGTIAWEEGGRAVTELNADSYSPLLKVTDDSVLVGWADKRNGSVGIYCQGYDFDGNLMFNDEGEENGKLVYWGLSGNASKHQIIKNGEYAYIAWVDSRYAHLGFQIKIQKIDQEGNIYFEENGKSITKHTGANQASGSGEDNHKISLATHHSGGVVLAWVEQRKHTILSYVQAIGPDGEMLWDEEGVGITNIDDFTIYQYEPTISRMGDEYIVAWVQSKTSGDMNARNVRVQKIVDGEIMWGDEGKEIAWQIMDDPDYPYYEDHQLEAVVEDYVVWLLKGYEGRSRLFVKKLGEDGEPAEGWDEYGTRVCTKEGASVSGTKSILTSKGLFVAWEDKRNDTSSIYGQIVDENGDTLWEKDGIPLADYDNDQTIVSIDCDGEFIYLVWRDAREGANSQNIGIQKIDLEGNLLWSDPSPFVCKNEVEKDQPTMSLVGSNVLVLWYNNYGVIGSDVYGQLVNGEDGSVYWDGYGEKISNAEKRQLNPHMVPFDDRYALAIWHDGRSSGKEEIVGLYAQKIDTGFLNVEKIEMSPVLRHMLHSNYPNPFNPETTIAFNLAKNDNVSLKVYNLKGQLVRSLIGDEYLEKGRHEVVWDGKDNSSKSVGTGMYFYKLEAKDTSTTKKMLLLK